MASGGNRPPNTLFVVASLGLFLFGAVAMFSSFNRWRHAGQPTPEQQRLFADPNYQGIMPEVAKAPVRQWVVVSKGHIGLGEAVLREMVERRPARDVVEEHPELLLPGATKNSEMPLAEGTFVEEPGEVEDKYAALPLEAGQPIARDMLLRHSPTANSRDAQRADRITIAMPPEPTVYPLLQPGDRVNIYIVVGEQSLTYQIPDVRVVAVNNIAAKGSGLVSAAAEKQITANQQAAQLEAVKIRDRQMQEAAKAGKAPPPETPTEAAEVPADKKPKEAHPTGGVDTKELPKDTYKLGRQWDGRAITVQVSRNEAQLLAMAGNTPLVRYDFAILRRR